MSSHREAPEISMDPVCDNTDTYGFISPDQPDTVTILTNYIPLEAAASGPSFYEFGNDVLYSIHICNSGSGLPDITYEFRFHTTVLDEDTFLYNTGPITSLDDKTFNRRQSYSVTKVTGSEYAGSVITKRGDAEILAQDLACPPCNIGPHSTPNYQALAQEAVHALPGGITVFAGQRNDGFFADLGGIFDLADLRPFQTLHMAPMLLAAAVDTLGVASINCHTIAIQVPITQLTQGGVQPTDVTAARSTIGMWGAASRRKVRIRGDEDQDSAESGPWVQVSRLGSPLFNELLVGQGSKDLWNRSDPSGDSDFYNGVVHPELATEIPQLYPTVFGSLAKLAASGAPRVDMEALFLTGIPGGIFSGFQSYTGSVQSDMLRLNLAVPPTADPNTLGLLGGDKAGYPNGRRVADDIVTIIVRAIAGVTYEMFHTGFIADPSAAVVTQGLATPKTGAPGTARFIPTFPYLGLPYDGFDAPLAATDPSQAS